MEQIGTLILGAHDLTQGKEAISHIQSSIISARKNGISYEGKKTKSRKIVKEFISERQTLINNEQEWMQGIEEIMIQTKKELFGSIEKDRIPKEKISTIASFFSEYQKQPTKESYHEAEQLFDNIDIDKIPVEKVPTVICFLADYLKSSHKEITFGNVKPYTEAMHFVKETNMNAHVGEVNFSTRLFNVFDVADIQTVGDLVTAYKANPKHFLAYPNFGKKSNNELQEFLEGHQLI